MIDIKSARSRRTGARVEVRPIFLRNQTGPRGDAYAADRTITADEAQDYHAVQLETLKAADVDLVTAITFNNVPESIGIARAAEAIGLPLCISLSLDSRSRLNTGPSLEEAIVAIDAATDSSTAFYMINCVHPLEYEPALRPDDWVLRVRGVRPNASVMDKISLCKFGHLEEGDPIELGRQVGDLIQRYPHTDILGGCCGTWDRHLDQIAREVRAHAFPATV